MSYPRHPGPEHRKEKKQRCADSPACSTGLLGVPWDIWPLVRDLAGVEEVPTWNLVCRQLQQLIATAEFWAGFEQPDFELENSRHLQILSLLVPYLRRSQTPLRKLVIGWYAALNNKEYVPLVGGLTVEIVIVLGVLKSPDLLGAFSAVRGLSLRGGHTHACLRQLRNATSLAAVHLDTSTITGEELRAALLRFTHLQRLSLECCANLTDSALQGLTQLQALFLKDCARITGEGLRGLQLEELDLQGQSLTAAGTRAIATLSKLQRLKVSNLRESDFQVVANLRTLTCLDLLDCPGLTGTNLPVLFMLDLETFKVTLTRCSPRSFGHLLAFPALVELRLQKCEVTSEDLAELRACRELTKLGLVECHAVKDLGVLSALPALSSLQFEECKGLASAAGLQNCGSLEEVDITACPHFTSLAGLVGCASLHKLSLMFTPVADLRDFEQRRPDVNVTVL